jgi:hypothetical protein
MYGILIDIAGFPMYALIKKSIRFLLYDITKSNKPYQKYDVRCNKSELNEPCPEAESDMGPLFN